MSSGKKWLNDSRDQVEKPVIDQGSRLNGLASKVPKTPMCLSETSACQVQAEKRVSNVSLGIGKKS